MTTDRPDELDLRAPSAARVFDCLLGGACHTRADRELTQQLLELAPWAAHLARQHRMFSWRAVRCLLAVGIRQFIDLRPAVFSDGNVHELAGHTGARVVYVDHDPDPVTGYYAQERLASYPDAALAEADIGDPGTVLRHPEAARLLDLSQPCGLLIVGMPFAPDPGDPVAAWRRQLASGSHVVVAHLTDDHASPLLRRQLAAVTTAYGRAASPPVTPRSREQITAWLDGMELLAPGVVLLPQWRPDEPADIDGAARLLSYAAVARLP